MLPMPVPVPSASPPPAPMLEERLHTAMQVYKQGIAKFLVLSGGPSEEGLHEVDFMKN